MKLKDLKTDTGNLFNEMEIFKDLGNIDDYYREFIYLYGERDLTNKVESMFNEGGLREVGWLFTLKTSKWLDLQLIDGKIKNLENTDKTIVNTGSRVNKGDKTRTTNTNNVNEVIPFDIIESVENEKNLNNSDEVENSTDNLTMENKQVYTGFSRDTINYFLNRFTRYIEFRHIIYADIINMITLQIY